MSGIGARRALAWALLPLVTACGSDYEPPRLETTGIAAAPVGQVLDLEVDLPNMQVQGAAFRGVTLEVRFELERAGLGQIPARVRYERARAGLEPATIEDLSAGRTDVLITEDRWFSGRLGPLRIGNTLFEILLDGRLGGGGFTLEGRSWESQTASWGDFRGWRRRRFLVAGTDFFSSAGRVAEVAWVKDREIRVRTALELVSSDPVLRVTGSAVFAVNRLTFDNLQRLDPDRDFDTAWQAGIGAGSNPHDVLIVEGVVGDAKGYVTRYEPPFNDVAVFDPRRGTIRATIPLASLAENRDGTPRADRMRQVGSTIFVGLQDIDRSFSRFGEGKLAVIDAELDEVVGVIPLGGKNPGAIEIRNEAADGGGRAELYVALSGIFPGLQPQELSGGVVVVDVTNRVLSRTALDDDDVGGNVAAFALASATLGYVVVSDTSFVSTVLAFDPTGARPPRVVRRSTDFVPEIEIGGGDVLAVPDRSFFAPGLCLYRVPADEGGLETPLGCAPLDLPPVTLEALD